MSAKTRTYLRSRFENGDIPNQDDYIDLFDSCFIKLEDTLTPSDVGAAEAAHSHTKLVDKNGNVWEFDVVEDSYGGFQAVWTKL